MWKLVAFMVMSTWISLAFRWLMNLRTCSCALDWRRQYMMTFYILGLSLMVTQLLGISLLDQRLILGVSASFIAVALWYVWDLYRNQCLCSESRERTFIGLSSSFQALVFIFWPITKKWFI